MRNLFSRAAARIRIHSIWLATEPMAMRAGTETALARVIAVFGAAQPHCAYLFANRRATRMRVLVHDGFGVWLGARRLNQGKFHWPPNATNLDENHIYVTCTVPIFKISKPKQRRDRTA
ncbi:IS66 family insertion sequence element accessory protein TnpB [Pseudomonas koreensis]|uniref:IS66 family insertion sequence element accessory protein TnpB n=1 Tax=Pseudomonas koreensis TaxID=198620 RepID=UPI003821423C